MSDAVSAEPEPDPLLIPILSASNFVIGMGAFIVIGLLNPIAEDLSLTTAEAGWITKPGLPGVAHSTGIHARVIFGRSHTIGER